MVVKKEYMKGMRDQAALALSSYGIISPSARDNDRSLVNKTSQKLQMLPSVTLNCQVTKIVMNSDSLLSEF